MRLTWEQIQSLDLVEYFHKHRKDFTEYIREVYMLEFAPNGEQRTRIEYFYKLSDDTYKEITEIIKARQKMPFMFIPAEKGFEQSIDNMTNKVLDEIIPLESNYEIPTFEDEQGLYKTLDFSLTAYEISEAARYRETPPSFYPWRERNGITTEELLNDLKDLV